MTHHNIIRTQGKVLMAVSEMQCDLIEYIIILEEEVTRQYEELKNKTILDR